MSEKEEYLFQKTNSCWICKKFKEHLNKNLIMKNIYFKEEHLFQKSNSCWICKKKLIMMKKKLEITVT